MPNFRFPGYQSSTTVVTGGFLRYFEKLYIGEARCSKSMQGNCGVPRVAEVRCTMTYKPQNCTMSMQILDVINGDS